jgi:hypothetical protein
VRMSTTSAASPRAPIDTGNTCSGGGSRHRVSRFVADTGARDPRSPARAAGSGSGRGIRA